MRMWHGVAPSRLCRQHLLGEHVEMHMFIGTLRKGRSIQGYIAKGLVVPHLIRIRHDALATEMKRRGMQHNSPVPADFVPPPVQHHADPQHNRKDLITRCRHCRKLATP